MLPQKCYCENQNGDTTQNGIFCAKGINYELTESCHENEWCTGPANESYATFDFAKLCEEGRTYILHANNKISN